MKKLGLIDDAYKPTELAMAWRDDERYAGVCTSILDTNYPEEIRDLFHTADADPNKIKNWFMNKARCGEETAKSYTRFYTLLLRADPSEPNSVKQESPARQKTPSSEAKSKSRNLKQEKKPSKATENSPALEPNSALAVDNKQSATHHATRTTGNQPEIHINVQLHISPESTAEQIDKIFESMAKHLKGFSG
jgi:hypothetical protein